MSATETEKKTQETEKVKVARGLQVREFEGSITDKDQKGPDGKPAVVAKFKYKRICFPWSRTGKDVDGKEVSGSVPTLAETMSFLQKSGVKTEFELDSNGEPTSNSIVGLLIDGWNANENQTSRAKALNTPDNAKAKAIQVYAKMLGISVGEAEKQLFAQA